MMALEYLTLSDDETGSRARLAPGFGLNCFEFQVAGGNGQPFHALWAAKDFLGGRERPSGSGIPILFPFPGRLRGHVFRWEGREYPLTEGDGRGNAIHGFVLDRPWRVLEATPRRAVGCFQASQDDPRLLRCWPADFRITVRYELRGNCLAAHMLVENPDDKPLPCGLGTHPYFRLPLGGARAEDCLVRLPVSRQWTLREMLATGEVADLPDAEALQAGKPFGQIELDAVLSGLVFSDGVCRAEIYDPHSQRTLALTFDRSFRECVVYTPPHREAICIEPYSCVPGCFELADRGIDAGLRLLAPGESFEAGFEIRVSG